MNKKDLTLKDFEYICSYAKTLYATKSHEVIISDKKIPQEQLSCYNIIEYNYVFKRKRTVKSATFI